MPRPPGSELRSVICFFFGRSHIMPSLSENSPGSSLSPALSFEYLKQLQTFCNAWWCAILRHFGTFLLENLFCQFKRKHKSSRNCGWRLTFFCSVCWQWWREQIHQNFGVLTYFFVHSYLVRQSCKTTGKNFSVRKIWPVVNVKNNYHK